MTDAIEKKKPEPTILVSLSKYRQLIKDEEKLRRLKNGGVNNWEWYGNSLYPDGEEGYDTFCDAVDSGKYDLEGSEK